jgi:hypothetical protein
MVGEIISESWATSIGIRSLAFGRIVFDGPLQQLEEA